MAKTLDGNQQQKIPEGKNDTKGSEKITSDCSVSLIIRSTLVCGPLPENDTSIAAYDNEIANNGNM